jgi:hypothetical protein
MHLLMCVFFVLLHSFFHIYFNVSSFHHLYRHFISFTTTPSRLHLPATTLPCVCVSRFLTAGTRGSHKTSFPALCPSPQSVINSEGALDLPPHFLDVTIDTGTRPRFLQVDSRMNLGIQFSLRLCIWFVKNRSCRLPHNYRVWNVI